MGLFAAGHDLALILRVPSRSFVALSDVAGSVRVPGVCTSDCSGAASTPGHPSPRQRGEAD